MRVVFVRQVVHLATNFFSSTGVKNVLAELFVSYESIVDTQDVHGAHDGEAKPWTLNNFSWFPSCHLEHATNGRGIQTAPTRDRNRSEAK